MTEQAVSDVPRTLYLLDDNTDFRTTAKWWLSGAGYDVVDFEDGQAAIAALQALSAQELGRSCLLLERPPRAPQRRRQSELPYHWRCRRWKKVR